MHTEHCTQHTTHYTLHTAYCTLHTAHCTLHSALYTRPSREKGYYGVDHHLLWNRSLYKRGLVFSV